MNKFNTWHKLKEPAPAIDRCGTSRWYIEGKLHNELGPAVIFASGTEYYYLNGNQLTKCEWVSYSTTEI